jgi:DNA segregation ATPase FtsK/SpoIIIE-like protein
MNTMPIYIIPELLPAGAGGFALPLLLYREGDRPQAPKLYPQSGSRANTPQNKNVSGSSTSTSQPPSDKQTPRTNTKQTGKQSPQSDNGFRPDDKYDEDDTLHNSGTGLSRIIALLEPHKREIAAAALMLAAVLLLCALLSYDALDYPNAKLSFSKQSLLPSPAASSPASASQLNRLTSATSQSSARTTPLLESEVKSYIIQNWLGFVGAWIAHNLYNHTLGVSVLVLPLLMAVWAAAIYKRGLTNAATDKLLLATALTLVGAAFTASIIGVMQLLSWIPDWVVRPEWSGSVGQFIARMIWQMIGSVGAFVVLFTALGAVMVMAIDLDVERSLERARREKARLSMLWSVYRRQAKPVNDNGKLSTPFVTSSAPHNTDDSLKQSAERIKQHVEQHVEKPVEKPVEQQHCHLQKGDNAAVLEQSAKVQQEQQEQQEHQKQQETEVQRINAAERQVTSTEQRAVAYSDEVFDNEPASLLRASMRAKTNLTDSRRELLAKYGDAFSTAEERSSYQNAAHNTNERLDSQGLSSPQQKGSSSEFGLSGNVCSKPQSSHRDSVRASEPSVSISAPYAIPPSAAIVYVRESTLSQEASRQATQQKVSPPSAIAHQNSVTPTSLSASEVAATELYVATALDEATRLHVQTTAQATAEAVAHTTAEVVAFETARSVAIEAARETARETAHEVIHDVVHEVVHNVMKDRVHEFVQERAPEHTQEQIQQSEQTLTEQTLTPHSFNESSVLLSVPVSVPETIADTLAKAEALASGRLHEVAPELASKPSSHLAQVLPSPQPTIHIATPRQPDVFREEGKQRVDDANAALDEVIDYIAPTLDLLIAQEDSDEVNEAELRENARLLTEKLRTFRIEIENLTVTPGPVVTQYEFVPAAGIKVSQIEGLADDIALALKARGIRIIAPVPGRGTVAVEIPNHKPTMVRFSSIVDSEQFQDNTQRLPLALGKTISGEVFCADLAKMPHLLIAGSTGSGKSVGINTILASLLYKMHPRQLKFVIVDPKKIEMSQYKPLLKHFLAVCPDIDETIITNPQNAVIALKSVEAEMERRYDILAKVGQRNIADYNAKVAEGRYKDMSHQVVHREMPYIVVVVDELADLMMTAGREVEDPIIRLAQLARAVGIHLVVATQRPSVDVVTGLIKANFPARIAFQVASKVDSRTILDMSGAEHLLGNGDMLFTAGGSAKPLRVQNSFLSTEEVERICEHISRQQGYSEPYQLPSVSGKSGKGSGVADNEERDELFEEAARIVVRHQQGSVSLLQRRLKIGYSRAARVMDQLEEAGVVGGFDGSKGRSVLIESEAQLEALL